MLLIVGVCSVISLSKSWSSHRRETVVLSYISLILLLIKSLSEIIKTVTILILSSLTICIVVVIDVLLVNEEWVSVSV
jgi:hypothetical protein